MTKTQFEQAVKVAKSGVDLGHAIAGSTELCGFGLPDFKPVTTTIDAVAYIIRWQAACFDGSWDEAAIFEVREAAQRKFLIEKN